MLTMLRVLITLGTNPPNIRGDNTIPEEVLDPTIDVDSVIQPNQGGLIPADNMDLVEDHMDPPHEAPNNSTSNVTGGTILET